MFGETARERYVPGGEAGFPVSDGFPRSEYRRSARAEIPRPVVCLDAGHGGSDPGAVGPSGLRESDIALELCLLMGPALELAGWRVEYTRKSDVYVGLSRRAALADNMGAALFVSMHCNAFKLPEAHGFEVWTSPGDTGEADRTATNIYHAVTNTFPYVVGRPDLGDGDPDKEARFTVLTKTPMPACLVEACFITNPQEEARLADPGWRLRFAGAVVSGIGSAIPWEPLTGSGGVVSW